MRKSTPKLSRRMYRLQIDRYLFLVLLIIFFLFFLNILGIKIEPIKENPAEVAQRMNTQCKEDTTQCLYPLIADYAKNHKFSESKAVLDHLQQLNQKTKYCHGLAHIISIAEVAKNPKNWIQVFSYVPDSECSYGFYHGVIEGKDRADPDFTVDADLIRSVCSSLQNGNKESSNKRSCTHAMGHIVLVQKTADIPSSLKICDNLPTDMQSPCYQGVFMEHIQKDNLSEHGIEKREKWDSEFLFREKIICEKYSESQSPECWRSLGQAINQIYVNANQNALNFCRSANSVQSMQACIREVVGINLINRMSSGRNNKQYVDLCAPLLPNTTFYNTCTEELIRYVLLTSKSFRAELQKYCYVIKPEYQQKCQQKIQNS